MPLALAPGACEMKSHIERSQEAGTYLTPHAPHAELLKCRVLRALHKHHGASRVAHAWIRHTTGPNDTHDATLA